MIRRIGFAPLLIIIVGVALALRVLGLNWDQGTYLHPDERFMVWVTTDMKWPESIGAYFNTAISPLNPYNTNRDSFVYGTFPSFLVKAIAGVLNKDVYGELHLVGRAVSAVFDTGTVVLTALIGRRFWSERVGLLAAFFLALTPLMLQTAHYFTVDSFATFFVVAAFWFAVMSWDRHSIAWMAVAGVMVGLAGASKPNALLCIAFLALPALELVRTSGWQSLVPTVRDRVYPAIAAGVTGGLAAFWTFRIAQPYAFAGPHWWNVGLNQQWLDDLAYWRAVQTGLVDMKPSIQWVDRTPVLYILQNLVLWGMGVALGATAMIGLGVLVWRLLRSTTWPDWFMLGMVGWSVGNILFYGTGIAQNQRYLMQIYPFLAVFAAALLIEIADRWRRWQLGRILLVVVTVYTIFYGLAFTSLFVRPITRIEASEWIYENVPAGSMISNEYWDDPMPMYLPSYDHSQYTGMTLDLYADESADNSKVTTLVGQLSQVDYVVISSNRVIYSVARQPERYPVANRFYEMLLNGELGFEEVAEFTQGPELFGIEWSDLSAEESLTVYEHPQVRIFKKTDAFSAQNVYNELNAAWGEGGLYSIPGDPTPQQMLMRGADIATANQEGSWSDQFGNGLIQHHPLLAFWLTMEVIGLLAWPLTWRAFATRNRRPIVDFASNTRSSGVYPRGEGDNTRTPGVDPRGEGDDTCDPGVYPRGKTSLTSPAISILAKATGLIALATITLTLVSWGSFLFARGTIVAAMVILLAMSLAALRGHFSAFVAAIRQNWRAILVGEGIIAAGFLLVGWMRTRQSIAPDVELMQFTSLVRSSSLPPLDLWFSGGLLHTYWAGLLPWAALARLLGIEPTVAFNATIVALLALLAGLVWSIVRTITRSHSWLTLIAPLLVIFVAGSGFSGGIATLWATTSVGLSVLAVLPLIATLMLVLILHSPGIPAELTFFEYWNPGNSQAQAPCEARVYAVAAHRHLFSRNGCPYPLRLLIIGVVTGAIIAGAEWGVIVALPLLAIGLMLPAWQNRAAHVPWWPDVRRFVLEIIAALVIGVIAWYPAIAAHTATARNLIAPDTWSVNELYDLVGPMLLLAMLLMAFGASLVLGETMGEGRAGVVVAVAAIVMILLMIGVAVYADSALLLIFLVSLLAIIALWHWLHDHVLAWSVALTFMASFLLAYAQTRKAHVDISAVIVTRQLFPVAWMLLALAVTLGGIHLIGTFSRSTRRYGTLAMLLITAILLMPFVQQLRSDDESSTSAATPAEVVVAQWLQNQSGMPVVLTFPDVHSDMLTLSGQPGVLGSTGFAQRTRPGYGSMIDHRSGDINSIFTNISDWAIAGPLLAQYDVEFIVVGNLERQQFPNLETQLDIAIDDGHLEIAFQSDDMVVYRVMTP